MSFQYRNHAMQINGTNITLDYNIVSSDQAVQILSHWHALGDLDHNTFCDWIEKIPK